jgi:hypothetical protein
MVNQTTQLGVARLGTMQLGRAPEGSDSVSWSPSSQLAFILLGLAALGYVDPTTASAGGAVPDMSTWYVALTQPARPIIEVEGY